MQNAKCKMQNWQTNVRSAVAKKANHTSSVGATTMFSKKTCRLAMWSSKIVSVTAVRSSVAQKRDLQKPSLVREGGRQTELAECRLTDE